ncbi:SMP-30/gluconolactonase/LRE family protein [Advenella mimigardefordensis]|uniref:Putative gluconolactonase n=1 Tax=Advenella mimigardefordensis (strain DSM 17166 / LMG 22922 / DPN7) TaxID=1247726 RepID=W0PG87_ADVMD|nr:SMP-30/gluconolactonase/LRE family protein [Advenella mimigardefordensis]AHG64113.1 putative gluconolactonase [Advenella mimigardefordensis DPN7]
MKHLTLKGEIIARDLQFPEGPVAMPDGSVLIVEIVSGRLLRIYSDQRQEIVAHLGGGPNGLAIGPDGYCYVCNNGGFEWHTENGFTRPLAAAADYKGGCIQRVHLESGQVDVLYSHCDGNPLHGPNDIVFDQMGGFWFTDMGRAFHDRIVRGAVYYAKIDGSEIRQAAFPVLTPNGIGLSPDLSVLYVAETETSRLWSYSILEPGILQREPWPSPNGGRLLHGLPGFQRFDSLAVEDDGNICVATLVNGGISVFSPDGELLEFHQAPENYCTNICFGGPQLRDAYITLSGYGQLMKVRWPRGGLALQA